MVSGSALRAHSSIRSPTANLRVATNTTVNRVLFEGDKAVGVETANSRRATVSYTARREVILSLGSISTPKLLQLSGVGDRSLLRDLGIDTIAHSPKVGRRMREHRCFAIQFRLNRDVGDNRQLSTPLRQAVTAAKYLATRRGPLARGAWDVIGSSRRHPNSSALTPKPDGAILVGAVSTGQSSSSEREPGIQAIGYIFRADSEGAVTITSSDPEAPLDIDPRYLTTPHDREKGTALFRTMRRLFSESPIADSLVAETQPGVEVVTDQAIIDAALDEGYCGYHAVGTCAMGPSDDDVVDPTLRVRGVHNLRVMDCSVMPMMVSGNLHGPRWRWLGEQPISS